jgi:FkbH-like protein
MTLSYLARELNFASSREGRPWTAVDAGFDSWLRETMDATSATRTGTYDAWGFLLSPRALDQMPDLESQIRALLDSLGNLTKVPTVLFATMFADPRGVLPFSRGVSEQRRAARINDCLYDFSGQHSWFQIVDHAGFVLKHGLDNLTDHRYEAAAQLYFSPVATRQLARLWHRALRTLSEPRAKVLVVDLDNTLWKGVLGEDDWEHLAMGASGAGLSYRHLQRALLQLRASGVLLAVCSKNNAADALAVLSKHPDCLLRPEHFACHEIGWEPKPIGLERIAERLSLGIDSLVFLDDSPFERESVRQSLPQVRVLDFPDDPADLVKVLSEEPAFDALRITTEDRGRAASYEAESQRDALRASTPSSDEFFRSLVLRLKIFRARAEHSDRLHQLLLKTNQFNLTAERIGANEFRDLLSDPGVLVLGIRVADRFADSGVTGLCIVETGRTRWRVRVLLLSCRVIGRTVEYALLGWLAQMARRAGAQSIDLLFVPTERNSVALRFLNLSGATEVESGRLWRLDCYDASTVPPHYLTIDDADVQEQGP